MDSDTASALQELIDLADNFPGQYAPEFQLGYYAGVSQDADCWYVQFEGDIRDSRFTVMGRSAAEVLRLAAREAPTRIP